MDTTTERTVSGRALIVVSLIVIAVIIAVGLIFGPTLRDEVRQTQVPRTLREPIATGTWGGEVWEAVGRFDGEANCVELRFRGKVHAKACDTGPRAMVAEVPGQGRVAMGVAPEERQEVTVRLVGADDVSVPVVAGDLGFPVGFWAVEVPAGATGDYEKVDIEY